MTDDGFPRRPLLREEVESIRIAAQLEGRQRLVFFPRREE
jgi:hypothetical protein